MSAAMRRGARGHLLSEQAAEPADGETRLQEAGASRTLADVGRLPSITMSDRRSAIAITPRHSHITKIVFNAVTLDSINAQDSLIEIVVGMVEKLIRICSSRNPTRMSWQLLASCHSINL